MVMSETIDLLIGAVFVAIFAVGRFRNFGTWQCVTMHSRYWIALVLYLLATECVFIILAVLVSITRKLPADFTNLLTNWNELLSVFTNRDELLPRGSENFSSYLIAALLLSVLLPKIPGLSSIDEAIKRFFQRMAALSTAAVKLSHVLNSAPLNVPDAIKSRIRSRLIAEGFDPHDIHFESIDIPHHTWTRLSVIWDQLLDWDKETSPYNDYASQRKAEYLALKNQYIGFCDKAKHCFKLQSAALNDPPLAQALQDCHRQYMGQMRVFLQQTCDFVSRGVLQTHLTRAGRHSAVRELGIDGIWEVGLSVHDFARIFIILLVVLLVFFVGIDQLFSSASSDEKTVEQKILLVTMIAISHSIALLCMVLVKSLISSDQPGSERPWGTYLLAGILTLLFSSLISIIYNSFLEGGFGAGAAIFIKEKYPWQVLPLTTAVVTSYLIDDRVDIHRKRWLRWKEGAIQSVWTMASAALVLCWLINQPPAWMVLSLSGLLGFIIGFSVPTWYRQAPSTSAPLRAVSLEAPRPATLVDRREGP